MLDYPLKITTWFFPDQTHSITPKIVKIEPKWFVSPGRNSSSSSSSNRNPKLVHTNTRRLAIGNVPPGGSSSRTRNQHKINVLPGGDSSPARRFLEKFQKAEFHPLNTVQAPNTSYIT